jgi:hypothetical protein
LRSATCLRWRRFTEAVEPRRALDLAAACLVGFIRLAGRRPLTAAVALSLTVAVVCGTASKALAASVSTRGSQRCLVQLVRSDSFYTPLRVRAKRARVGPVAGRATVRCERALVCARNTPCTFRTGKALRTTPAHSLRGFPRGEALVDERTRRVYVNLETCAPEVGRNALKRCVKPGLGNDPAQTPSPSFLGSDANEVELRLGGEFCWSEETGPDTSVRRCVLFLPPWLLKSFYPLVVTEPGASVPVFFSFEPTTVQVTLFDAGVVYVSEELTPSAATQWEVPSDVQLPKDCFVEFYVTRLFQNSRYDFAHYVARLHIRAV